MGRRGFRILVYRSVSRCVNANLVDGKLLHMDGSLIDANASKGSVLKSDPEMIERLREVYQVEEAKLESAAGTKSGTLLDSKLISTTDPDAPCVCKKTGEESRPRHKVHRGVDDAHGVITATETTPGDVEENAIMRKLAEQHQANAGDFPESTVADTRYGTMENYRNFTAMGIATHMSAYSKGRSKNLYPLDKFR